MARPKKTGVTPKEAAGLDAFKEICEYPLPARADVLQSIVCALLARIRRMDEQAARQMAVFVQVLAARDAYWGKHRLNPLDGLEASREWSEYRVLLCEIALGERTKKSHCKESLSDQTVLLDQYLEEHSDFLKCRNATTRRAWLTKHASDVNELLSVIPCFCTYDDKLVATNWPAPHLISASTPNRLTNVLVEPKWLKAFLDRDWTAAKLRDALLAILHGTQAGEIVQIKKKPGSFTSDSLLFRPLDAVMGLPQFGSNPDIPSR